LIAFPLPAMNRLIAHALVPVRNEGGLATSATQILLLQNPAVMLHMPRNDKR